MWWYRVFSVRYKLNFTIFVSELALWNIQGIWVQHDTVIVWYSYCVIQLLCDTVIVWYSYCVITVIVRLQLLCDYGYCAITAIVRLRLLCDYGHCVIQLSRDNSCADTVIVWYSYCYSNCTAFYKTEINFCVPSLSSHHGHTAICNRIQYLLTIMILQQILPSVI